jgi:hypothetical protein
VAGVGRGRCRGVHGGAALAGDEPYSHITAELAGDVQEKLGKRALLAPEAALGA